MNRICVSTFNGFTYILCQREYIREWEWRRARRLYSLYCRNPKKKKKKKKKPLKYNICTPLRANKCVSKNKRRNCLKGTTLQLLSPMHAGGKPQKNQPYFTFIFLQTLILSTHIICRYGRHAGTIESHW